MAWRFLTSDAYAAAALAAKNAISLIGTQLVLGVTAALTTGPSAYSVEGFSLWLGPRGIAVVFAMIGALWRWHRYQLNFRQGTSGCAFSTVLAFIIGDGQVPYGDMLTAGIAKESIPMMNGFLMGLFGLLLVTGVQDFMAAYRARKEAA